MFEDILLVSVDGQPRRDQPCSLRQVHQKRYKIQAKVGQHQQLDELLDLRHV